MVSEMARQAAASLIEEYWSGSDAAMMKLARSYRDGHEQGAFVRAFARFEAAIRADQVERDAKVAESWKLRWAEDHKRFDDQFWEAGAAVAEQIENDIRQKGSDHAG